MGQFRYITAAARSLAVYGHYAAPNARWGWASRRCAPIRPTRRYFQSGHALGRYAQSMGTMTALRKGLGGKTRELFEERSPSIPTTPWRTWPSAGGTPTSSVVPEA